MHMYLNYLNVVEGRRGYSPPPPTPQDPPKPQSQCPPILPPLSLQHTKFNNMTEGAVYQ